MKKFTEKGGNPKKKNAADQFSKTKYQGGLSSLRRLEGKGQEKEGGDTSSGKFLYGVESPEERK